MPASRQQLGARAQRNGQDWERRCVLWLREHGYPAAGYEDGHRRGDLTGVWDLSPECTVTDWSRIWAKLRQADRDVEETRGPDLIPFVWKKQTGKTDPAEGAIIVRPSVWFAAMKEFERRCRADVDADAAFDRGYRLGQQERGA